MSSKKKHTAAKRSQAGGQAAHNTLKARNDRNLLFLPVILALAIIPLTVHLVVVSVDPNEAALIGNTTYGDIFSHSKVTLLIICAVVMLILAAACHRKFSAQYDRRYTAYLVAGGLFVIMAFLSAVLSKDLSLAFWGSHDRAEGFVTLLCYLILLLFTMFAYRSEADYRHILIALSVVVAVSSVLGVSQYAGHDFFSTAFGKALIVSPWDGGNSAVGVSSAQGKLYGTFFHYDYVGSFAAIVTPMFLVLMIAEKQKRTKIALGVMVLLSLWLLFGSTSRAGVVGLVVALIFAILFFAKVIAREWKVSLTCFAVILIAAVSLNFAGKGKIFSRIPSLAQDVSSVFQSTKSPDYLTQLPVKNVSAEGNTVNVVTQQGNTLKATLSSKSMTLKDENGKAVDVKTANGTSAITDPRFSRFGFSFVPLGTDSSLGLVVVVDGQQQFYFRVDSDQKLTMTNPAGTVNIDSIKTPPIFGFKGKEKLGSARGYIWSRALPMVPDHLILGSGPDTFILNFPQNDLLGKYWAYGTTNMVVDKPHNLYLQILLNEGGIALAAFLTVVFIYLVDSIRLYALKREYCTNQIYGAAACLGVVGYLFAGLFNDSIVCVAPVFWIILGVGIAVNVRNRRKPGAANGHSGRTWSAAKSQSP